ncbi:MAG TPA: CPBP family glutamic-type intramembrane protease, partial [Anaerolineae bacterium]|nr:CPBP family glutamic-type intramembrane protease [Anaerolineae bacterium]
GEVPAGAGGRGAAWSSRGPLQPILGVWPTAMIFALAHIQYGATVATVVIIILAVVLGYVRERHNTSMVIFIHAGYDFVLGMLSLLALQVGG